MIGGIREINLRPSAGDSDKIDQRIAGLQDDGRVPIAQLAGTARPKKIQPLQDVTNSDRDDPPGARR